MYTLDLEYQEETAINNGTYYWGEFLDRLGNWAQMLQTQSNDIVRMAWDAYFKERKNKKPKYARVARVYAPLLREYLDVHPDAREIYSTLMLEQTQPFGAIDSPYGYYGDDDNVRYVEVDSYTGQPLDDISEQQEALAIGDRVAMVTPQFKDDVALSISKAYKSDTMREAAMKASAISYQPLDLPQDEFTIDRGISSEPIKQMMENELRIDYADMTEVRNATNSEITAFNQRRSEFFLMLKKKEWKYVPAEEKMGEWRLTCQRSDERRRFLDKLQWLANKGFEPQYLAKQFLILQNEDWGLRAVDAHEITLHAPEVYWETEVVSGTTEYKRCVRHGNEAIPMGDDNSVPDDWDDLFTFIVQFGDAILEDQGTGQSRTGMKEHEILSACDHIEEEYLDMMPESSDTHRKAPHTRVFLEGMFSAITDYSGDLKAAGYAAWREDKSLGGAYAYNRTYSIETLINPKDARRKAWTAFYRASTVVSLSSAGLKVKEILTSKVQVVSYNLAAWKVKRGEIYLTESERVRLLMLLEKNNFGHKLQGEL